MNLFSRISPWVVGVLATFYVIYILVPPSDPPEQMQLRSFARIPVMHAGRIKPIDSYARTNLMLITNRQTYKEEIKVWDEQKGEKVTVDTKTRPAIQWLLEAATTVPVNTTFTITDPELLKLLQLPPRENAQYRFEELYQKRELLVREALKIRGKKPNEVTPAEMELMHLAVRLERENQLNVSNNSGDAYDLKVFRIENDEVLTLLELEPREGFRYSLGEIGRHFTKLRDHVRTASQKEEDERDKVDEKLLELANKIQRYQHLERLEGPANRDLLMVPPTGEEKEWQRLRSALMTTFHQRYDEGDPPPAIRLRNILLAYARDNTKDFNKELTAYRQQVQKVEPTGAYWAAWEAYFNEVAPFYHCTILYVFVLILVCVSWLGWTDDLKWGAFTLALITLGIHTAALVLRMCLQGRPPVTNLYSSAVFVGWGCAALSLWLEWLYRNTVGTLVTAILGFTTMLLAHHFAGSGDTLDVLQAVLDTNFWLATHVTCITLGYTATLVAGVIGMVYIFWGVFTRMLDSAAEKSLTNMTYGVICFAMLLSFVGTVLGGIWADQSWGRFWGWDPKENGALLLVLWNALILHARWGGMIKKRGLALLAVAGIIITGWSWIGTNQLGVGLHAYGFNSTLTKILWAMWGTSAAFIGLGLVPRTWWRSSAVQQQGQLALEGAPSPTAEEPPAPPVSQEPRLPRGKKSRKVKAGR